MLGRFGLTIGRGPCLPRCGDIGSGDVLVCTSAPAARPAVSAAFDITDAEALLVRAFEQIGTDTPTVGTVKNKMLVLDPSFDQANYGCRTFRDFLNRLSHRVATAGRSGADITIRLIHTRPDRRPPET